MLLCTAFVIIFMYIFWCMRFGRKTIYPILSIVYTASLYLYTLTQGTVLGYMIYGSMFIIYLITEIAYSCLVITYGTNTALWICNHLNLEGLVAPNYKLVHDQYHYGTRLHVINKLNANIRDIYTSIQNQIRENEYTMRSIGGNFNETIIYCDACTTEFSEDIHTNFWNNFVVHRNKGKNLHLMLGWFTELFVYYLT